MIATTIPKVHFSNPTRPQPAERRQLRSPPPKPKPTASSNPRALGLLPMTAAVPKFDQPDDSVPAPAFKFEFKVLSLADAQKRDEIVHRATPRKAAAATAARQKKHNEIDWVQLSTFRLGCSLLSLAEAQKRHDVVHRTLPFRV